MRFMLKEMAKINCPISGKENLVCAECDDTRSGGFDPEFGILLCQNRFIGKTHVEDTIAHELVHAYDHW